MLDAFLERLNQNPNDIQFEDTMAVIDNLYIFTPSEFTNGSQVNEAGQNSGSCKLFAFAKLQELNEPQTLACFGQYYRRDVLENPNGDDHQNIRNFMKSGWAGIRFSSAPLSAKS